MTLVPRDQIGRYRIDHVGLAFWGVVVDVGKSASPVVDHLVVASKAWHEDEGHGAVEGVPSREAFA